VPRKPAQVTHDLREITNGRGNKWDDHFTLQSRGSITWSDANPELLASAIATATEDGVALLFSKTSDGGALSIHVLAGTSTHKLYPATPLELSEALQLIVKIAL
jgi:hypothetical protein